MTEKKKIQKIEDSIVYLPGVRSVGVIGDPGCDGLGTYNMKVYAGTLEKSGRDDITLVVGDLVPEGSETYYKMFTSLTEEVAHNDVYVLRGNHDTGTYRDYFGRQNYALILEDFSIVVLDNALRTFEKEGLELLRQVLDMEEIKNIVIAFHIPVP
ncbi:metallophosphoesterase, partial [bacterium 1XD42-8]